MTSACAGRALAAVDRHGALSLMRFVTIGLLCVTATFLVLGCAAASGPDCDAQTLAARVAASQPASSELSVEDSSAPGFGARVETVYGLAPEGIRSGSVRRGSGASPELIMVLETSDSVDAEEAAAQLETYIEKRIQVFEGYSPEAVEMLAHRALVRNGSWIGLFVCPEPEAAQAAFEAAFTDKDFVAADSLATAPPAKTAPPAESAPAEQLVPGDETGRYDHDAVVSAYRQGNPDGLDPVSRAVYDTAENILNEIIEPGMSEFDKELAVHDYITSHVSYDEAVLEDIILPTRDLVSADAYGALVQGEAVCYGYADSFQLLMDMLGIECITVDGTANEESEPHAWNMVRLDGRWYCVDVTWDDPVGMFARPTHRNFNITNEQMLRDGNRVPAGEVPLADGGPWAG